MPSMESEATHETAAGILEAFLGRIPPTLEAPAAESPRGRILTTARKVFAERGFDAGTTRTIAAAAGVNQAMIAYYFGSKRGLYLWVIAAEFQEMIRAILHRMDRTRPAAEILIELPLGILQELEQDGVRADLLRREIAAGAHHIAPFLAEMGPAGPRGMRALIRPLIREEQATGVLPHLPADMLLQFLLSLAYGALFLDPFFAVMSGRDLTASFRRRRRRAFRALLRRGLLLEEVNA